MRRFKAFFALSQHGPGSDDVWMPPYPHGIRHHALGDMSGRRVRKVRSHHGRQASRREGHRRCRRLACRWQPPPRRTNRDVAGKRRGPHERVCRGPAQTPPNRGRSRHTSDETHRRAGHAADQGRPRPPERRARTTKMRRRGSPDRAAVDVWGVRHEVLALKPEWATSSSSSRASLSLTDRRGPVQRTGKTPSRFQLRSRFSSEAMSVIAPVLRVSLLPFAAKP